MQLLLLLLPPASLHPLWKPVGCGILCSGRQTALGVLLLEGSLPTRLLRFLDKCFNEFVSVAGLRNRPCYWRLTADSRSEFKKLASLLTDRQTICSSTRLSGWKHNLSSFFGPFAQIFGQHFLASRLSSALLSTFFYGGHTSHVSPSN